MKSARRLRDRFRTESGPSVSDRVVPRTAGVLVVRDALDVTPLVIGHHLRVGIERIHVIDDGSSDGTSEFLDEMARRTPRVTHHRVLGQDDPQLETVSEASNRLIEEGARLVVPFDADEFWDVTADQLEAWVSDDRPRSLTSHWINFAQARENTYPRTAGMLDVRHRAELDDAATEEAVGAFRASFLQYGPIPKAMVRAHAPVAFSRGQHDVHLVGEPGLLPREPAGVDVLHVPLRWKSELTKRAFNSEPRRARQRAHAGDSWQSLFHLRVVEEQRDDEVWAANSADASGHLDVYGRRVALVPDDRVHRAVDGAGDILEELGIPRP
jgi:hypothetical protein